jgi:YesN/AraC family two-component response regulator
MIKEKYGFVYIWFDSYRKMYYIGSHWGSENDSYICSSNRMRDAYRRRPNDFKRRILKNNINDRKETLLEEHKWLSLIEESNLGKKYYNLRQHLWGHWSTDKNSLMTVGEKISASPNRAANISKALTGIKRSEETKEKVRQANIGKKYSNEINNKKGINSRDYSDINFKEKMSIAAKNRSNETKMKISENNVRLQAEGKIGMKGKKHSPETIEKMKESAKLRELNKYKENSQRSILDAI